MPLDVISGNEGALLAGLEGKRIAILGYGNQGRAHALNLRDSGLDVCIGARRDGRGWRHATDDGFAPLRIEQAVEQADLIVLALPDEVHAAIWSDTLGGVVQPGQTVGFIHGFSIRFGLIKPPEGVGIVMVAPKGPGATVRMRFERGEGIPALLAVKQASLSGDSERLALGWAAGIGSARAAIIRTTFAAEAESDLFGEQAVLCGGMIGLMRAAFETLVQAGFAPEIAYLECCHEVKQVADLMYERGLVGMTKAISNTAEFGMHEAASRIVDDATRERMRALLADVQSGDFARRVEADHDAGLRWLLSQREALGASDIEHASAQVRSFMPFLQPTAGSSSV